MTQGRGLLGSSLQDPDQPGGAQFSHLALQSQKYRNENQSLWLEFTIALGTGVPVLCFISSLLFNLYKELAVSAAVVAFFTSQDLCGKNLGFLFKRWKGFLLQDKLRNSGGQESRGS
ncbi:unnamed protein product [Lota lota]